MVWPNNRLHHPHHDHHIAPIATCCATVMDEHVKIEPTCYVVAMASLLEEQTMTLAEDNKTLHTLGLSRLGCWRYRKATSG